MRMDNPFYAEVWVKINGIVVTGGGQPDGYQHSIDMNHYVKDSSTGASSIDLTFYDDTAVKVLGALTGGTDLVVWYDYSNKKPDKSYNFEILTVDASVTGTGALTLTVKAQGKGPRDGSDIPYYCVYRNSPSDLVTKLSKERGWKIGRIVKTLETKDSDYDEAPQKNYYQLNKSDIQFIQEDVIPEAVSEDGEFNYKFQLCEQDGQTYVYFFPTSTTEAPSTAKTYVIGDKSSMGSDEVISFDCNLSESVSAIGSTANVSLVSSTFAPLSNDHNYMESKSKSFVTARNSSSLSENLTRVRRYLSSSSTSFNLLKKLSDNLLNALSSIAWSATLTIMGDPSYDALFSESIEVRVYTKDGVLNPLSAKYIVNNITHTISGGNYTTTLGLYHEVGSVLSEDSVQTSAQKTTKKDKAQGRTNSGSGSSGNNTNNSSQVTEPNTNSDISSYGWGVPQDDYERRVLEECASWVGTPYVYGGISRGGVDCSGFTMNVTKETLGIDLYHKASYQQDGYLSDGKTSVGIDVGLYDLKIGDLVFFGDPAHHTGIYVGNNKVVHAPQTGDYVKTSTIGGSWNPTSARRFR